MLIKAAMHCGLSWRVSVRFVRADQAQVRNDDISVAGLCSDLL
jgi:hypothetical protein